MITGKPREGTWLKSLVIEPFSLTPDTMRFSLPLELLVENSPPRPRPRGGERQGAAQPAFKKLYLVKTPPGWCTASCVGQLLFRQAQRRPKMGQMLEPLRTVAGCVQAMRAACGAGCQTLHLQPNGWQVEDARMTEKKEEIGPDL